MKYLGIDFGTKRIGLAVSDDEGTIAFPFETILNTSETSNTIMAIVKDKHITEIVIGIPTTDDGEETSATNGAHAFAEVLAEKCNVPIHKIDERFTSHAIFQESVGKEMHHARKTKMKKPTDVDAQAAALILQRYLDSHTVNS